MRPGARSSPSPTLTATAGRKCSSPNARPRGPASRSRSRRSTAPGARRAGRGGRCGRTRAPPCPAGWSRAFAPAGERNPPSPRSATVRATPGSSPWMRTAARRTRRKTVAGLTVNPRPVDLDGDGRDELVLAFDGRLRAWGRDLADLWSWPSRAGFVHAILPAAAGRSATVVVPPSIGLDGATGRPRWAGFVPRHASRGGVLPELLDAGNAERLPLFVSTVGGATACRSAVPAGPGGSFAPTLGARMRRGPDREDPRPGRGRSPGWRSFREPSSPRHSSRCSDSRRSTSSRRSRSSGWPCVAGPGRSDG